MRYQLSAQTKKKNERKKERKRGPCGACKTHHIHQVSQWDGPSSLLLFYALYLLFIRPASIRYKGQPISCTKRENWTLVNCYKFDLHFDRLFLSSLHISFHCPSLPSLIFRKGNAHRAILCLLSRQIEFTSIYSRRTSWIDFCPYFLLTTTTTTTTTTTSTTTTTETSSSQSCFCFYKFPF